MKKYILSTLILTSVALAITIPIQSGYDMTPGNASYSDGALTNNNSTIYGFLFASNVTGFVQWQIPEQVFLSNTTNAILSAQIYTTNGVGQGHTYAYTFRLLLYTNVIGVNGLSPTSNTNLNVAFYDSGDMNITGTFYNGTNITHISTTNTVATNIFNQTNLAFGVIKLTHNSVGGSIGTDWLLNAHIFTR